MVKGMVVVILLAIGGFCLLYFGGGLSSYDPAKKGEAAKAAISTGMTWKQVVDAAGEPGHYQTLVKTENVVAGDKVEELHLSTPIAFDTQLFENEIKHKTMPDGFVFNYMFTMQVAFDVAFDANGVAAGVVDARTAADFFQTRK